jgi:hypothetical protein
MCCSLFINLAFVLYSADVILLAAIPDNVVRGE